MSSSELATRVAAQRDPAVRPQLELRQQIQGMADQFQLAMPKGLEATQLVRDALTCLRETPRLAECDPQSVLGGLMTAAQLGLRPAVLGQAWLLPMYDRKAGGMRAQLIIGYQGLTELAYRSNRVASISSRIVYANDEFDIRYGDDERLFHKPFLAGDRGPVVGYYSVARLVPEARKFEYMSLAEMQAHRDSFAMAKRKDGTIMGPWRDQFDAMALKTTIRRLAKTLPKSPELITALTVDGGIRLDMSPKADASEVTETVTEVEVLDPVTEDPWAAAQDAANQNAAEAGYGDTAS